MQDVLKQDFEYIRDHIVGINKFRNASIMITGGTGLIGSLLTRFFLFLNSVSNYNVTLYVVIRDQDKANRVFNDCSKRNLHYIVTDLENGNLNVEGNIDYIIHTAAITKSKLLISKPVDVIKLSANGTEQVLDLAVQKEVKSVVYLSSMEVYGQLALNRKIREKDLGTIDLSDPRSCYPESKRICECMCNAYAHQYDLDVKIARLAQTFGAGVLSSENRVFAQFARSIMAGKNIVLHTTGQSEGNYVYTADALTALLVLLLKGKKGQSYNIVNESNHSTIKNMALEVTKYFGTPEQKVVIDIPDEDMGYAPDVHMHLSNEKLRSLGWKPSVGLIEMYNRMIKWMQYDKE